MNRKIALNLLAATVIAGTALAAAPATSDHPGFFAIESLGLISPESVAVDVDLSGPMLRIVAAVLEGEDEDRAFALLVSRLERIRVQVGEIRGVDDLAEVRRRVGDATALLDRQGWQRMVLVREDGELIAVYVKGNEERIDGLTVLALDDELAMVNLVGSIEPKELGRLLADLDRLPSLEDLDLEDVASGGDR